MRRFWGWLGLNLGKRAGLVAVIGLLVTIAFGYGVTTLRFTTTRSPPRTVSRWAAYRRSGSVRSRLPCRRPASAS